MFNLISHYDSYIALVYTQANLTQANLIQKGTAHPPIMLRPIMFHYDGTYETYHQFCSHMKCALGAGVDTAESAGATKTNLFLDLIKRRPRQRL